MDILIAIVLTAITPLCLYLIALLHPPTASAMRKHTGIVLAVSIVGAIVLNVAFTLLAIDRCRATTGPHIVTDNLGNFYTTEYKHSGEWCQWVRGTFNRGS